MKQIITFTLAGLALAGLAGCEGMELGKAQNFEPKGSPFDVNLYAEYLTLATSEYDEYDFKDSDVFASRALAAGMGNATKPEEVSARPLPEGAVAELANARQRLMAALDGGAAQENSFYAARAQAMFDCWMQEQEENRQPDHIAACRADFEDAMARLEESGKMVAEAKPMPAKQPDVQAFMVFFDFDSAQLTPGAREIISGVAEAVRADPPKSVVLIGHTDRAGAPGYNKALSVRRVEAVVAAFEAGGAPASVNVVSAGQGEESPRVVTEDGVRSAGNRRVEIALNR